MKKYVLIALSLVVMWQAGTAQVQDYNIIIAGVQVTDTNADSITGQLITGTVKYIDSTKTLFLKGATIGSRLSHSGALITTTAPLTIVFEDTNYIEGNGCLPMILLRDTTVFASASSSSVLNIGHNQCNSSSFTSFIQSNDIFFSASGTINIGYFDTLTNAAHGTPLLKLMYQNDAKIHITDGTLNLCGSTNPIVGYKDLVMQNRYLTSPRNTYYDTVARRLSNPLYPLGILLISSEYTPPYRRPVYPIKVAGTQVTVLNADSITGPGVSGHVSFDSISNTLTLENATITTTEHNGIEADSSITINCIGYNIVNCCNNDAISHSKIPLLLKGADFTIQGVSGNDTLAISTYRLPTISTSDNLHISNLNLLSNFGDGISKYDTNNTGDLTITNSIAKIIGGINCGPISMYNNLNLIQCEIVRPVGHRYSTANQRIEDPAGNLIRYLDTLVIEKTHVGILSAGKEKAELMPNPVSTNLYVVSESVIDQLQVFDTYGRLLKTLVPNTKRAIVNLRELPNGIYTILIKSQNGTTARQFVVKH